MIDWNTWETVHTTLWETLCLGLITECWGRGWCVMLTGNSLVCWVLAFVTLRRIGDIDLWFRNCELKMQVCSLERGVGIHVDLVDVVGKWKRVGQSWLVSWVLGRGQIEPKLFKVKGMVVFLVELKFTIQPPPSLASQQEEHDCTSAAPIFQKVIMIPKSQHVGEPPLQVPSFSVISPRKNWERNLSVFQFHQKTNMLIFHSWILF